MIAVDKAVLDPEDGDGESGLLEGLLGDLVDQAYATGLEESRIGKLKTRPGEERRRRVGIP
jgi:hypothetical protein